MLNFVLILFKRSVKIKELRQKKTCLQIGFAYKQKCHLQRKVSFVKKKLELLITAKLVAKIKKHNQLFFGTLVLFPVDTGRKLNVHKTFRRRSGRLLNVLRTFNLRPVSTALLWR